MRTTLKLQGLLGIVLAGALAVTLCAPAGASSSPTQDVSSANAQRAAIQKLVRQIESQAAAQVKSYDEGVVQGALQKALSHKLTTISGDARLAALDLGKDEDFLILEALACTALSTEVADVDCADLLDEAITELENEITAYTNLRTSISVVQGTFTMVNDVQRAQAYIATLKEVQADDSAIARIYTAKIALANAYAVEHLPPSPATTTTTTP